MDEPRSIAKGISQSFSLVFVGELGDRTFFMIIIYSTRFLWYILLPLAMMCMVTMHCISTSIGFILSFIPRLYTKIIVTALFLVLGSWMIGSTCHKMRKKKGEDEDTSEDEFEEVLEQVEEYEAEVHNIKSDRVIKKEEDQAAKKRAQEARRAARALRREKKTADERAQSQADGQNESSVVDQTTVVTEEKKKECCRFKCQNQYLFFIAMLTCAEWGDKSQVSAISLASKQDAEWIAIGGGMAHILCIVIALICGHIVKRIFSEETLIIAGGCLFVCFGLWELIYELILENYKDVNPWA